MIYFKALLPGSTCRLVIHFHPGKRKSTLKHKNKQTCWVDVPIWRCARRRYDNSAHPCKLLHRNIIISPKSEVKLSNSERAFNECSLSHFKLLLLKQRRLLAFWFFSVVWKTFVKSDAQRTLSQGWDSPASYSRADFAPALSRSLDARTFSNWIRINYEVFGRTAKRKWRW